MIPGFSKIVEDHSALSRPIPRVLVTPSESREAGDQHQQPSLVALLPRLVALPERSLSILEPGARVCVKNHVRRVGQLLVGQLTDRDWLKRGLAPQAFDD